MYGYLINCEYFNNLNRDRDMVETGIIVEICTSTYLSHTQLKKLGIPHTHTHTQLMQKFSIKTRTDSDNTHEDEFFYHIQDFVVFQL